MGTYTGRSYFSPTDYILNNYVDDDIAQFPSKIQNDLTASTNRITDSCESFHA